MILTGDLYDICNRIKEIDPDYFIVRNTIRHRFEVHSSRQRGNTLALVVPYDRLDARTLQLVRQSRIERMQQYLSELENENMRLQNAKEKQLQDRIVEENKEVVRYRDNEKVLQSWLTAKEEELCS